MAKKKITGLEFIRSYYNNDSIIALKEWKGAEGTLGVYQTQQGLKHVYLLVLVSAIGGRYFLQINEIKPEWSEATIETVKTVALKNAQMLAEFAGAKEL